MLLMLSACFLAPSPPGPLHGSASITAVLQGSGPTAAQDGPRMMVRLGRLGVTGSFTQEAPDRLAIEAKQIQADVDLQAQLGHRGLLEIGGPVIAELTGDLSQGLTNKHIKAARAEVDEFHGRPHVTIELTDDGGQRFCDITGKIVGKPLTIVYDGVELSAPVVRDRICGGEMRISMGRGQDSLSDAQSLAASLGTTPLSSSWTLESVR